MFKLHKNIKWVNLFLELLAPAIVLGVGIFLSYKNFVPGTWLTGWDNLHPEFNLVLNIKRSFYGVWQEYQGLGLLGGMAHAADLPRQVFLLLVSFFVSTQYLRYFWTFLMLILGPLGVYFLISKGLTDEGNKFAKNLAGLTGGLFYLNNLASVQYFYTPYESFVSFYGFLPWLIYLSILYLRNGNKRSLVPLVIMSIAGTASFYVQTLFLVFFIILSLFVIETIIRERIVGIKKSIILGITIFTVNAFWLLPSLHFSFGNSKIVTDSKINSFSTPEIQLFNEANGNLADIASLKGFWFEYTDVAPGGGFEYLMPGWRDHLDQGNTRNFTYVLFALSALGVVLALSLREMKYKFSIVTLFIICYFMLSATNPPLGKFYSFLTENISFLGTAFRSVFTKWSVPAAMSYSIGLGFLVYTSASLLRGKRKLVALIISAFIILLTFKVVLPAYKGELVYKRLRIDIPQKYFDLFKFFDKEPNEARVAFFPMQTFWGWNFYDWDYRGSGFVWYGIKQPILDRAFDVWSNYDEAFYHEASNALYADDKEAFLKVLKKYDVSYLLLDESVDFYGVDKKFLRYEETKDFVKDSAKLVYDADKLHVYQFGSSSFVKADYVTPVDSDLNRARLDAAFNKDGDYYFDATGDSYPFSYLYEESDINVTYNNDKNGVWINLEGRSNNVEAKNLKVKIPALQMDEEVVFPAKISLSGRDFKIEFKSNLLLGTQNQANTLPGLLLITPRELKETKVSINGTVFDINQGEVKDIALKLKVGEPISVQIFDVTKKKTFTLEEAFLTKKVNRCWTREGYEGVLNVTKNQDDYLSIETKDAAGCFAFKIGKMESVNFALFDINLPFKSHSGAKPSFCIVAEDPVYKCLNDDIFYNELPSNDWTSVRRQLVLDSSKIYWIEIVAKPPDMSGEGWTLDYKEPITAAYPISSFYTFDESIWEDLLHDQEVVYNPTENFNIRVFSLASEVDFRRGGRINLNNCDVLKRGEIEREINKDGVFYLSKNEAANCDFVSLNTLSTKNAYLARFIGEGIEGRGLKFYLYNKASERNDLEILLGKGNFDKSYPLLSWNKLDGKSYVLNIENRSFGSSAYDKIDRVILYQLPLTWLTGISIDKSNAPENLSAADIVSYKKTGTYRYDVSLKGAVGEELITLSQGYDKGWNAYSISNFKNYLPFLFGKKLEHIKVNSWENGWITQANDTTVVILYWPQYLEYLGFVLGILTFAFSLAPKLPKIARSKPKKINEVLSTDSLQYTNS